MKIAIVGAGIAGTTCALELHGLGHEVEVFEMANQDAPTRPRQMEGSVHLLHNVPEIETDRYMKKIKLHAPKISASLNGKLGFFYEVGGTNGIEAKVRKNTEKLLPIHYSTKIENKTQLDRFQIIIAADGYRSLIAKQSSLLTSNEPNQIGAGVGFTVKGDFDPELIEVWIDNYYSSHGYAYIIPFSKNEASLVSASIGKKLNQATYRMRLKELAHNRNWETQNEWVDLESWYQFKSYATDKLYVVGNAASFVEPAFGFGLKWAIKSAKLCSKAIHQNLNYNHLIHKKIMPDIESFQIMKRYFDTAKTNDYDKFVKKFTNPIIKTLAESGTSLFQYKRLMNVIFPKTQDTQQKAVMQIQ